MTKRLSLSHLHLPAEDPDKLRRWYRDKLGFIEQGNLLWSEGTLLAFTKAGRLNNPMVHFGFRFSTVADLLDWHKRLLAAGVAADEPEGDQQYQCFRINDPEGNEIEFFFELSPEL